MKRNSKRHTSKVVATALYARERAWVAMASLAFALAFMTYMYFLCVSVVHVVMRQEIDAEIAQVSNEISALETRYIEAQNRITKNEAIGRGFREASDKVYVSRTPSSLVLRTER